MVKAIQFHRITPKVQFCGTWNYPEQFEDFLLFLCDNFEVVMPGEKRDGFVITFDDGDRSVYDHAFPILKKYGVRAVVFLAVGYIGMEDSWDLAVLGARSRHLAWPEIHEMKEWGIEFGSHTMSHRNLTRLTISEMDFELKESKRILEEQLGPVDCISYPFNRVNQHVVAKARQAGYKFGFGGRGEGELLIKKEAVYITDNVRSLKIKLAEQPRILYNYDRVKQKAINCFTMITMLTKRSFYAKR
ncbi:MAG: polysaccharide deacetylase family protein [candidate division WOR-3 bacterium]|nr:MAG: polysaccharide deacetylase family protein [candidate division WOR-3 bacterium]